VGYKRGLKREEQRQEVEEKVDCGYAGARGGRVGGGEKVCLTWHHRVFVETLLHSFLLFLLLVFVALVGILRRLFQMEFMSAFIDLL
jgi:hypothetical protein